MKKKKAYKKRGRPSEVYLGIENSYQNGLQVNSYISNDYVDKDSDIPHYAVVKVNYRAHTKLNNANYTVVGNLSFELDDLKRMVKLLEQTNVKE